MADFPAGGRKFTARQLAGAMRRYENNWPKAVERGGNNGLKYAHRYAITKRMTGGGKRAPSHPDKLRKRSGKLARSVRIIKLRRRASGSFEGGLKAGGPGVPYARIHEKGGVIRARNAPYLVFKTPDGSWHSVKRVRIPPRPYLAPALLASTDDISREVRRSLEKLAGRILG